MLYKRYFLSLIFLLATGANILANENLEEYLQTAPNKKFHIKFDSEKIHVKSDLAQNYALPKDVKKECNWWCKIPKWQKQIITSVLVSASSVTLFNNDENILDSDMYVYEESVNESTNLRY